LDQKKGVQLPPLRTTLIVPDPADRASMTLERDERWSFVFKKAHDFWMWIALCRKTRQVIAYAVGDRSKKPCLRLWKAIPSAYRQGHCFTDCWATYAAVIPGGTAHSRRKRDRRNCPCGALEQHTAAASGRFVRMTLSFSKSVSMHEACLLLFLHRYNSDLAILLK
jgi:insertion element IS1 protein InsB